MTKIKSEVAPKGIHFNSPTSFMMSGKYYTTITIVSYPRSIYAGFLSNIGQLPGVRLAIKHIPVPFDILRKMLNKEIADLKVRYQEEKDVTAQERIRQDYESLEQFVSMLAATQSRIFDFQLHLLICGDDKEDLERKKMQVRNYLDSMGMKGVSLMFEQEKVLKSIVPIFPAQDIEDRIGIPIPSVTIAGMYPFVFDSIKDPGAGTLLGVDSSGGVILFNQFFYQTNREANRTNANMIILGTTGSGKSTAAKLMLRTNLRNGLKCVCIDPEGELEGLCKSVGGDFIDLGKGRDYGMINPLEIVLDIDQEEIANGLGYTVLARTISQAKAFMKYYSPTIEDDVLETFSDVLQDTYRRFHIDYNTDFSKLTSADYPTFDHVYATVKGRLVSMTDASRERDVLERLELKLRPLCNELRFNFNGTTTVNLDNDFVVFNIKDLMNGDANIKNALFFNILKYAWGLCLDKTVNTCLMVDEAHILLSNNND